MTSSGCKLTERRARGASAEMSDIKQYAKRRFEVDMIKKTHTRTTHAHAQSLTRIQSTPGHTHTRTHTHEHTHMRTHHMNIDFWASRVSFPPSYSFFEPVFYIELRHVVNDPLQLTFITSSVLSIIPAVIVSSSVLFRSEIFSSLI